MTTILNDDWVYLRPGDMLRLWNKRGGVEIALVIAVVHYSDAPHEFKNALIMSRSHGLSWINERDLMDSKRYEIRDP